MKHVSLDGLDRLEPFLDDLRSLARQKDVGLKEKKRGVFYRKSRAFLHFHEHPGDDGQSTLLFADVRLGEIDFDRHPATTRGEQRTLLELIREAIH